MDWASMVLPLAGVVIGAGGTLLGQHMALRVDARREAASRAADQRAERKDAIIGFLSAAERVEQYRSQLAAGAGQDGGQLPELLHAAWLAKKVIELVCSGALAQAAQDYTEELDRASREWDCAGSGRLPVAVSDRERLFRREFMETARREMGYAGERMQRRAGAAGTDAETGLPASVQAARQ